eukprot:4585585-Ditylum_brightwellii.AAC.1
MEILKQQTEIKVLMRMEKLNQPLIRQKKQICNRRRAKVMISGMTKISMQTTPSLRPHGLTRKDSSAKYDHIKCQEVHEIDLDKTAVVLCKMYHYRNTRTQRTVMKKGKQFSPNNHHEINGHKRWRGLRSMAKHL